MMRPESSWLELIEWLRTAREIHLPRGKPFRVRYNPEEGKVIVTPSLTGIERRIGREYWERYVNRFNEIERTEYDPFRPGHYAAITHNSSYMVALTREADLNQATRTGRGRRS
jgi:hypothetical protein